MKEEFLVKNTEETKRTLGGDISTLATNHLTLSIPQNNYHKKGGNGVEQSSIKQTKIYAYFEVGRPKVYRQVLNTILST